MWQQARARLRNTDARLCVLVDCPSAGAWAQSLLAVPAAAAFASGIAVQASCRAGEMAWSQDIGGEAGGVWRVGEIQFCILLGRRTIRADLNSVHERGPRSRTKSSLEIVFCTNNF